MNQSVRADLVHFVNHLVMALRPIAKAEDVELSFSMPRKAMMAVFHPGSLTADLATILSKLIEFTPEQERISVALEKVDKAKSTIVILVSGINLTRSTEITHSCHSPVVVSGDKDSTRYELEVELFDESLQEVEDHPKINGANYIPDYYAEIRKRLRSHFTKADNLVASLERSNPREATFLVKVNGLIIANLENPQFDANYLSEAMSLSRTQLFRRLKPIIRQSPGRYIRTMKLQKAKELFESTDMRISEVAYKTGFESASHFTKMFTKQFGVKPSVFRRKQSNATNE
jgi:AraC-like DNA-binding protein